VGRKGSSLIAGKAGRESYDRGVVKCIFHPVPESYQTPKRRIYLWERKVPLHKFVN